jgi:hypothetical protein
MKVDLFLPCAPKDLFRIKLVLKHALKHVKEINNIHICTPSVIEKIDIDLPIQYHIDTDVLPNVNPYGWRFRPNWIYQQMLKLFQQVTETEYYYTLDADTLIIKDLPLFENDKPIWYRGFDQPGSYGIPVASQYRRFNSLFFPDYNEQLHTQTFIGDMCLFNSEINKQILKHINMSKEEFITDSQKITHGACHISESEFYGYYILDQLPDLYVYKKLNQMEKGKLQTDPYSTNWNIEEVKNIIAQGIKENFDVISMHSWCISSHEWNQDQVKFL